MKALFASLGTALIAGTEIFSFAAGLDGILFFNSPDTFKVVGIACLIGALAVAAFIGVRVWQREALLAGDVTVEQNMAGRP